MPVPLTGKCTTWLSPACWHGCSSHRLQNLRLPHKLLLSHQPLPSSNIQRMKHQREYTRPGTRASVNTQYPAGVKHICITCRLRGHKARDCENTPEDTYMFVSKPKPRIDSTVPWTCRENVTRPSHTYRYHIIVT